MIDARCLPPGASADRPCNSNWNWIEFDSDDDLGLAVRAVTASKAHDGYRVAVPPLKHRGSSPELAALADGFSEEVVTGLSRFSYFRVSGRVATLR